MIKFYIYLIYYLFIFFGAVFISKKLDFTDIPNKRKIHKTKILNTGGIIIFIFYLLLIKNFEFNKELENFIIIGFFILLIGFIDDRKNLNPGIKLAFISIPSVYLIISEGLIIYSLGDYQFLGSLSLGKTGIIFTFLSVIVLINSVNYLDGIDGLLLSFVTTIFGYFIILTDDKNIQLFFYYLLIPIFVNLIFNFFSFKRNLKIFNGDAGSLFFGFLISFFLIYFHLKYDIDPIVLAWGVWLPVYDFLFVTIYRLVKKKKIYDPDNNHLHHFILKKMNYNHLKSVIVITFINISIIFIGFNASQINKDFSFVLFILLFITYISIRFKKY